MQRSIFRFLVVRLVSFSLSLILSILLFNAWTILADKQTAFLNAAYSGQLLLMKTLYAMGGIDVNAGDVCRGYQATPLAMATLGGQNDVIRFLLKKGADVNGQTPDGYTPIKYAISSRNESTLRLLIANGADVNTQIDGYTLLNLALDRREFRIAQLLRTAGAKENAESLALR